MVPRDSRRARSIVVSAALFAAVIVASGAASCTQSTGRDPQRASDPSPNPSARTADTVVLSIIGTNDVHGTLDRLPILAGFINNLRASRTRDGGGVLVIDAGDMFQGTIESNSNEGAALIDAYNAIGYTAATIGNHEFDFGPSGPKGVPQGFRDDPRGALKERLRQARFPVLTANILDAESNQRVDWPNAPASVLTQVADVQIGIIGVTAMNTLRTTKAANVVGLTIAPLADAIAREARVLRQRGATLVIVTAHAGGRCEDFSEPDNLSSCLPDQEIMQVARALPRDLIDVIVAGHTHQAMAHRINGVAIIESYANGRAFGRVDVVLNRRAGQVQETRLFAPHNLCTGKGRVAAAQCQPGVYEGQPVVADPAVMERIASAMQRADELRQEPLGVEITDPVTTAWTEESALGNLFADLMRQAVAADVAVTNSGGIRANLPAGPMTYGVLYEAMPFDNSFVTVQMRAAELAQMVATNLAQERGILLISGVRAEADCTGSQLRVSLTRDDGRAIAQNEVLSVVTSDFLVSVRGGPFDRLGLPARAITTPNAPSMRDGMAEVLRKQGGALSGLDPRIFDPKRPRIQYPMPRPVRCSAGH